MFISTSYWLPLKHKQLNVNKQLSQLLARHLFYIDVSYKLLCDYKLVKLTWNKELHYTLHYQKLRYMWDDIAFTARTC